MPTNENIIQWATGELCRRESVMKHNESEPRASNDLKNAIVPPERSVNSATCP